MLANEKSDQSRVAGTKDFVSRSLRTNKICSILHTDQSATSSVDSDETTSRNGSESQLLT